MPGDRVGDDSNRQGFHFMLHFVIEPVDRPATGSDKSDSAHLASDNACFKCIDFTIECTERMRSSPKPPNVDPQRGG